MWTRRGRGGGGVGEKTESKGDHADTQVTSGNMLELTPLDSYRVKCMISWLC